jgi:photosystem II stability/assembly factor-like uncharacterized protein
MNKAVGFLFALYVLAMAAIAFSERSDPPMPPTEVRIENQLMLDAVMVEGRIVAVGERGRIFVSDDDGRQWRAAAAQGEATLTAVARVEGDTLVAVGHDAVIQRSSDRGATWVRVHEDGEAEEPLLAVRFADDGRGIAVGAYGRFMDTGDGGLSWVERELNGLDFHFNAIAAAGDVLILAGEAGSLLRSEDGGETWEELEPPYEGSFFGALTLADDSVLIFGMRGHVFRSDDGGDSWQELETGSQASLFGGRVLADGRVVLVGQSGALVLSDDEGRSFRSLAGAERLVRAAVVEVAGDEILLIGEEGFERIRLSSLREEND